MGKILLPDYFRIVNKGIRIAIPALKRPTLAELQAKYSWITKIERDDSSEEVVTLRLATVLVPTEPKIYEPMYEERLVPLRSEGRLLGFQHRQWMLENQDTIPDLAVRGCLKALLREVYIDFPGIIVVREDGRRRIPYVHHDDKRWDEYWRRLDDSFYDDGRIAVDGNRCG